LFHTGRFVFHHRGSPPGESVRGQPLRGTAARVAPWVHRRRPHPRDGGPCGGGGGTTPRRKAGGERRPPPEAETYVKNSVALGYSRFKSKARAIPRNGGACLLKHRKWNAAQARPFSHRGPRPGPFLDAVRIGYPALLLYALMPTAEPLHFFPIVALTSKDTGWTSSPTSLVFSIHGYLLLKFCIVVFSFV